MANYYLYIVEGKTEHVFVDAYKNDIIWAGKVEVFNLWNNDISKIKRKIKPRTTAICILDIDVMKNIERLNANLKVLEKLSVIAKVIVLIQYKNFEDEIVGASANIKHIRDIYGSKKDFKSLFCAERDVKNKLSKISFDINKMWQFHEDIKVQIPHQTINDIQINRDKKQSKIKLSQSK
ncbi:hypothetical protein AwWohl_12560 [Gammaproteobacteria bacterium]|nr:hypothetical protein AwWohl_12560 [Gammaproteobacteria bacterium]